MGLLSAGALYHRNCYLSFVLLLDLQLTRPTLALKVVPATFLLICFVCLKESTCETRKNVFYSTSKAFFVLEIIKF